MERLLPPDTGTGPPPTLAEEPDRPTRPAWGCLNTALAVLALLALLACLFLGFLSNALNLLALALAPITLLSRLVDAARRRLEFGLLRHPLRRELRWYRWQCLNRWAFWALWAFWLPHQIVRYQLSPEDRWFFLALMAVAVGALMLLEMVPPKRVLLAGNLLFAAGWMFLVSQAVQAALPLARADAVILGAPFRGEWFIFHGGRTPLLNHHYLEPTQSHALDISRAVSGRETTGDPQKLESYAAFGQSLYAPAAGRVVRAVNDLPDMLVGRMDGEHLAGNQVVIEIGRGKYVLLAHLQKGSVLVQEGDTVRCGQPVGRCGNSGHSSAPHLHFQAQNRVDIMDPALRTYPVLFRNVVLRRGDRSTREAAADVRRNDRLVAGVGTCQ